MEAMEMKEIEAAVEGILFASGEPVAADRIAVALELDRDTVDQVLRRLTDYYSYERRGMRLVRMEDTWQLCSAPEYADVIRRAFEIRKPAKLSQLVYRGAAAGPAPHRGMRPFAGAGTAPAVPHHQGVSAGVSSEVLGRPAGNSGAGGGWSAAAGPGRRRSGSGTISNRRGTPAWLHCGYWAYCWH